MSVDSAPIFEKVPTFDEIVKYAVESGIFGKISLTKFYDYYGDFKTRGGCIIDWKAKLHQWVDRQNSVPVISAKEYEARDRVQKRAEKKAAPARDIVAEIQARVAMI
jgi:hypothetical protein